MRHECCKKTKMPACHHAQDAREGGGPFWTAASGCPKDCSKGTALRVAPPAFLITSCARQRIRLRHAKSEGLAPSSLVYGPKPNLRSFNGLLLFTPKFRV